MQEFFHPDKYICTHTHMCSQSQDKLRDQLERGLVLLEAWRRSGARSAASLAAAAPEQAHGLPEQASSQVDSEAAPQVDEAAWARLHAHLCTLYRSSPVVDTQGNGSRQQHHAHSHHQQQQSHQQPQQTQPQLQQQPTQQRPSSLGCGSSSHPVLMLSPESPPLLSQYNRRLMRKMDLSSDMSGALYPRTKRRVSPELASLPPLLSLRLAPYAATVLEAPAQQAALLDSLSSALAVSGSE